MNVRRIAA